MTVDPHRVRLEANQELHARPFPLLPAHVRLVHLCVRVSPKSWSEVLPWIKSKLSDLPSDFHGYWERTGAESWVRVERHTEFVAITQVVPDGLAFSEVADSSWVQSAPQDLLVMARLTASVGGQIPAEMEAVSQLRSGEVLAGSNFTGDTAGFSAWHVVFASDPGEESAGRLLQMILEIETYRTLAVMGMDKIRAAHPILQSVASELPREPAEQLQHGDMMGVLNLLSAQEARLQELWERLAWRIGANSAYHNLVFQRLDELSETAHVGQVGLSHFLRRRLTPAVATAETVMRRRSELAEQVDERAQLLRTQLQLNLQSQTRDLLASLERSAATQIRLQTAVEGLSTVAIAYYAVGLITPLIEPFVPFEFKGWVPVGVTPVVILGVWWALSRIRNRFSHNP